MKLLILNEVEQQTLPEMGVFHAHPRVRIRTQAIVRLRQGPTLQQTTDEFHVHLNSTEAWRRRWGDEDDCSSLERSLDFGAQREFSDGGQNRATHYGRQNSCLSS